MPDCKAELLVDDSRYDPITVIGDIAHLEAASDKGPRANRKSAALDRDRYENLILLCKNCHAKIDGQRTKYSVAAIRRVKIGHELWVRASLPERGVGRTAWSVIVLHGGHPIDVRQAVRSLSPDYLVGRPKIIRIASYPKDWGVERRQIGVSVEKVLGHGDSYNRRFAVFPLARVSACVALGYFLTDRPHVKLFQYHRHSQSWNWPEHRSASSDLTVSGVPEHLNARSGELLVCFEISAPVQDTQLRGVGRNVIGKVRLSLRRPSVEWLQSPSQLCVLSEAVHGLFQSVSRMFPNAAVWHLMVATPAPVAVMVGQAINPTMSPAVQLYEFDRSATPAYTPSVRLGGEDQ